MVHDTHVQHHLHKRKRTDSSSQGFVHSEKLKNWVDKAVYVGGFVSLGMTIPQILKIWVEKNAAGISVISWITYMIVTMIWILYAYVHKEKPLLYINSSWIAFYILIIVGAVLYG